MFGTAEGTIDQALERERVACRRELRRSCRAGAPPATRHGARARGRRRGDWNAEGCSPSAQWVAQLSSSDYRTAQRITSTGDALRHLPALDHALSTGALTLDQVAAAAPFATPESDAEIARIAVGKAPSQISLAARTHRPAQGGRRPGALPAALAEHDLDERRPRARAQRTLPLEQGTAFEQAIRSIAKTQRAADKHAGTILDWQQSAADALVTLVRQGGDGTDGVRRSPTTLIVHLSPDAPPMLEGAGPISLETAERLTCDARRLTIKPHGRDLVHSRVGRCASYPQLRALHKRSPHCQYPGCTATRELQAHHLIPVEHGGATELANLILLCSRHHKLLHDHHIRTSGNAETPIFKDQSGRAITTNQPHAPPG